MGGMMGGYGFGGLGILGAILNLVITVGVIIGIVVLVIWLVRRAGTGWPAQGAVGGGATPREILQTRYARGEITRDQYQQMLSDLS